MRAFPRSFLYEAEKRKQQRIWILCEGLLGLPQFLTVEEWRTFMRIGRSSAYDLIRQGLVPVVRWGRTVRISHEAVMRFVNGEGRVGNNDASDGQAGGVNP